MADRRLPATGRKSNDSKADEVSVTTVNVPRQGATKCYKFVLASGLFENVYRRHRILMSSTKPNSAETALVLQSFYEFKSAIAPGARLDRLMSELMSV